jgi:hypothetical protein
MGIDLLGFGELTSLEEIGKEILWFQRKKLTGDPGTEGAAIELTLWDNQITVVQ